MAGLAALVTVGGMCVIPAGVDVPSDSDAEHLDWVDVDRPEPQDRSAVDWIGGFAITLGLLILMFALTEGNVVGWSTPWISVLLVLSIGLVGVFVWWQRYLEQRMSMLASASAAGWWAQHVLSPPPLMKVSMFRSTAFCAAMLDMALFFASFNGFLVFATLWYQDLQALSPLDTTLRFLPTGIASFIPLLILSFLLATTKVKYVLCFGNVCMAVASLLYALPTFDLATTSYFAQGLPAMTLSVFGADTTWAALTLFTSSALPQQDQALGGALVNSVGQFGRAIGLAIGTAVQVAVTAAARGQGHHYEDEASRGIEPWEEASWRGLMAANWVNVSFAVLAIVVVVFGFRGVGVVGRASGGHDTSEVVPTASDHVDMEPLPSSVGVGRCRQAR